MHKGLSGKSYSYSDGTYVWNVVVNGASLAGDGLMGSAGTLSVPEYDGATSSADGTDGLVPAALSAEKDYLLAGSGDWVNPATLIISSSAADGTSTLYVDEVNDPNENPTFLRISFANDTISVEADYNELGAVWLTSSTSANIISGIYLLGSIPLENTPFLDCKTTNIGYAVTEGSTYDFGDFNVTVGTIDVNSNCIDLTIEWTKTQQETLGNVLSSFEQRLSELEQAISTSTIDAIMTGE